MLHRHNNLPNNHWTIRYRLVRFYIRSKQSPQACYVQVPPSPAVSKPSSLPFLHPYFSSPHDCIFSSIRIAITTQLESGELHSVVQSGASEWQPSLCDRKLVVDPPPLHPFNTTSSGRFLTRTISSGLCQCFFPTAYLQSKATSSWYLNLQKYLRNGNNSKQYMPQKQVVSNRM